MSEFYLQQIATAFIVIVGCYILFRILFLWWLPFSLVAWKRVDYLWLFTSVVAIFLAIAANHQALAKTETDNLREDVVRLHKNLEGHLVAAITGQCVPMKKSRTGSVSEECARLKELKIKYDFMKSGDKLIAQFFEKPANQNTLSKHFIIHAKNYENSREKLEKDLTETAPTYFSTIAKLVAPSIFGALLALRLTKVTADVRAEEGKIDPSLLADDGRPVSGSWSRERINKKLAKNETLKIDAAVNRWIIVKKNREKQIRQIQEKQAQLAKMLNEFNN